jgi:FkbM family methyltransferase
MPDQMAQSAPGLALASNVRLVDGHHGRFFVLTTDTYIGRSLSAYGEWTEAELDIMLQIVRPNDHVVDIGANIGCHTVPVAKAVAPDGAVLAFEPQPRIFQLLAANITINGLANVRLFPAGCGDKSDLIRFPEMNYNTDNNWGGIRIEHLTGTAKPAPKPPGQLGQLVPVFPLDEVYDLNRLRLIKIDVEGMELDVLHGAERTIRRLRPVLYVENEFPERSESLLRCLSDLDYVAYWHVVSLFNPRNFRNNPDNLFGRVTCVNNVCVPVELKGEIGGLRPVADVSEHPRRKP